MSKQTKIIFIVFLVVIIIGAVFFIYYNKNSNFSEINPADNANTIVGGDRDAHGCIGSAGYSWCEEKNKCLRVWEEACSTDPENEIQNLLAQKYDKPIDEVTVTVIAKTDNYMRGKVSFVAPGLPQPGEGGMFLAAKVNNVWTLVYDGNGSIDCNAIKTNYQFPTDMLTGFCD